MFSLIKNRKSLGQSFATGLMIFFFLFFLSCVTHAAAPPAGSSIRNIATAEYVDDLGANKTMQSNEVTASVYAVNSFTLASSQTKTAVAPSKVYFSHKITNSGNSPQTYTISSLLAAGGANIAGIKFFIDANEDAVPDNAIAITSSPSIAALGTYSFVMEVDLAASAPGAFKEITVSVTDSVNTNTNTDRVNTSGSGVLVLNKTLSITSGDSPNDNNGQHITVQIDYSNTGNAPISSLQISDYIGSSSTSTPYSALFPSVAGASVNFNTSKMIYVPASTKWSKIPSVALTDASDASVTSGAQSVEFSFDTNTKLWQVKMPTLNPNESGSFTFLIDIDEDAPLGIEQTSNTALGVYNNSSIITSASSPVASYNVTFTGSPVDYVVEKTAPPSTTAGYEFDYKFTIKNIGAKKAKLPFTLTDTLPQGIKFVSTMLTDPSVSCSASGNHLSAERQKVVCEVSTLLDVFEKTQEQKVITIKVSSDANFFTNDKLPAVVNNTASISSKEEKGIKAQNNTSNIATTSIGLPGRVSGKIWLDIDHNRKFSSNIDQLLQSFIVSICPYEDSEDGQSNITQDPLAGFIQSLTGPAPQVIDCNDENSAIGQNSQKITSVLTDASGQYSFGGLESGRKYKIQFRDQSGKIITGTPLNQQGTQNSYLHWSRRFLVIKVAPGDNLVDQNLPLDPSGVVYDSKTRKPVAGAKVRFSGPSGFDPALHLLGGVANVEQITTVTGAANDGMYQYILIGSYPSGVYSISVESPTGYLPAPSFQHAPIPGAISPPVNCLMVSASVCSVEPANSYTAPAIGVNPVYYMSFNLSSARPIDVVNNHIPLDPIDPNTVLLLLSKTVSKAQVDIGESTVYTLKLTNPLKIPVTNVKFHDILPLGFIYQKNTARTGLSADEVLPDPVVVDNTLVFNLNTTLAPSSSVSISYRVQVSALAQTQKNRKKINYATAHSAQAMSNTASASVELVEGVFTNKSYIFGKVYAACSKENLLSLGSNARAQRELKQHSQEDAGLAGVRIFLSNGAWVITDDEGKYSFFGLEPRSHTLKIDPSTLPANSKVLPSSNRQLGSAGSYFVDLKNADMFRADFVIACDEQVKNAIATQEQERKTKKQLDTELLQIDKKLELERQAINSITPVVKSAQATGVLKSTPSLSPGALPSSASAATIANTTSSTNANSPSPSPAAIAGQSIEQRFSKDASQKLVAGTNIISGLDDAIAKVQDNKTQILNLVDNQVATSQQNILIKGPIGANLKLSINSVEVPQNKIARRISASDKNLQAVEYVAVELPQGEVPIELLEIDPFGNTRAKVSIKVKVAGEVKNITLSSPTTLLADGITEYNLVVNVSDQNANPVLTRLPLTVETGAVVWSTKDLDSIEPGLQTFIEGASATLTLRAPVDPTNYIIKIRVGNAVTEQKITFLPNMRSLIATGLIEGALRLGSLKGDKILLPSASDGFEQEIEKFSSSKAAVRTALFLKGKVKGDYLLTLSYDSDKNTKDRLYRDINPDKYYPIYGDSSTKGFEAQSSEKLYVRIEKEKNFLLYGDFSTQSENAITRGITQYSRIFTGAKTKLESANGSSVEAWASQTSNVLVTQEISATGTSGPYQLSNFIGIIPGSERVEIITRDKTNPQLVVETQPRSRGSDYEFSSISGTILFSSPISSFDNNLNPVYIRITFESDSSANPYWVYGTQVEYKLTKELSVGAIVASEKNPTSPLTLAGAWANYKNDNLSAKVEIASTSTGVTKGSAVEGAVEYKEQIKIIGDKPSQVTLKAQYASTDSEFKNPTSTIGPDAKEVKLNAEVALTTALKVSSELSQTDRLGTSRQASFSSVSYEIIPNSLDVRLGLRSIKDTGVNAQNVDSVQLRLGKNFTNAQTYLEYEQELASTGDRRVIALGADYKPNPSWRLYARHEFVSTLSPALSLTGTPNSSSMLGAEYAFTPDTQLYSEYKIAASAAAEPLASVGLKTKHAFKNGLNATLTVENIKSYATTASGSVGSSFAISTSLEKSDLETQKWNTKAEYRTTATEDTYLLTGGWAKKIDDNWTALAKASVYTTTGSSSIYRLRALAGAAYRPSISDDANHWLKVERYTEDLSPLSNTSSWAASWHSNIRPTARLHFTQRLAFKRAQEHYASITSDYTGALFSGRVMYDLTNKIDLGLTYSIYKDSLSSAGYGLGLEIGYNIDKNMWLSLGYGWQQLEYDSWLSGKRSASGVYVKFRAKFDEDSAFINSLTPKAQKVE